MHPETGPGLTQRGRRYVPGSKACPTPQGPQWVRCASPQLAPTAPATSVFIALSSITSSCCCCPLVRVFNGWGQGQGPFLPSPLYQVSCRLLGCGWGVQTFGQAHALAPGRPACRAVPLRGKGCACRSGVIRGQALASAGPSRPCLSPARVWLLGLKKA